MSRKVVPVRSKTHRFSPGELRHGQLVPEQALKKKDDALSQANDRLRSLDQELAAARRRQRLFEDELRVKAKALAEAFHRETALNYRLQALEMQVRQKELEALRREDTILRRFARMVCSIATLQFRRNARDRRTRRDRALILDSGLFEYGWYSASYPDVPATGIDPLTHFIEYGAAEGRSPSPAFDTKFYLAQNPDVAKSGINPLIHYLQFGKAEGRAPFTA